MNLSNDDPKDLQRFLDGELDPAAAAAFRERLAADPALARLHAEQRAVRAAFAAARSETFAPPAGFAAGVVAAVRQLPARDRLEQQEVGDRVVRLCRRLLLAAAVLFGLGLVWHSGLLDTRSDQLEAAPDEIHQEMERLDALIRAQAVDGGGQERR